MTKPFIAALLAAVVTLPALAEARGRGRAAGPARIYPGQQFIGAAYAKRLVARKSTQLAGRRWGKGWRVTLDRGPLPPAVRPFRSSVKWGKGPHILIATPTYTGMVVMTKGPAAPKGADRVRVTNPIVPAAR